MAYCSYNDILDIIPETELVNLTVDEPDENSKVDMDRFSTVANYADELINGYLRAKYSLPLLLIPDLIKKIAADIVAYRLYIRRPQDMPEHIKENFKEAKSDLANIQKGNITLDTPNEHPDTPFKKPDSAFLLNKTPKDKIFNNTFFQGYRGFGC